MRTSVGPLVAAVMVMSSVAAAEPPGQQPTPEPGSTRATFESADDKPLVVVVDNDAVCRTPCSVYLPALRRVKLEAENRDLVEVGYLPEGSVFVRGKPASHAAAYAAVTIGTLSTFGLIAGVPMAVVGAMHADEADARTVRNIGIITTGASVAGMYLTYR